MDRQTSLAIIQRVRLEKEKQADSTSAFANAVQDMSANQLKTDAWHDVRNLGLASLGIGAAGRGVVGLINMLRKGKEKKTRSGPINLPIPIPEDNSLQPKFAGFLSGDSATSKEGIPWYQPAMLASGLAGLGIGWKGLDTLLNARSRTESEDKLDKARKDFHKALMIQHTDPGIKLASEDTMEKVGTLLDEVFDKFNHTFSKYNSPHEKQAFDWGNLGGQALGGYGAYAGLSGLLTGSIVYDKMQKRSRRAILEKALKKRQQRRFSQSPTEIEAIPESMPSFDTEKLGFFRMSPLEKWALSADLVGRALRSGFNRVAEGGISPGKLQGLTQKIKNWAEGSSLRHSGKPFSHELTGGALGRSKTLEENSKLSDLVHVVNRSASAENPIIAKLKLNQDIDMPSAYYGGSNKALGGASSVSSTPWKVPQWLSSSVSGTGGFGAGYFGTRALLPEQSQQPSLDIEKQSGYTSPLEKWAVTVNRFAGRLANWFSSPKFTAQARLPNILNNVRSFAGSANRSANTAFDTAASKFPLPTSGNVHPDILEHFRRFRNDAISNSRATMMESNPALRKEFLGPAENIGAYRDMWRGLTPEQRSTAKTYMQANIPTAWREGGNNTVNQMQQASPLPNSPTYARFGAPSARLTDNKLDTGSNWVTATHEFGHLGQYQAKPFNSNLPGGSWKAELGANRAAIPVLQGLRESGVQGVPTPEQFRAITNQHQLETYRAARLGSATNSASEPVGGTMNPIARFQRALQGLYPKPSLESSLGM